MLASRLHTPLKAACRHASTQPLQLPDKKMHALISLYHQTETFVTKENLSQKIDEAFLAYPSRSEMNAYKVFESLKERRDFEQSQPAYWEWEKDAPMIGRAGEIWSAAAYSLREARLMEALYGVDTSSERQVRMPGLDAVRNPDAIESGSKKSKGGKKSKA
ncbi:hypothetical protein BDZ89DRAFT_102759 [Hymenopellis radicata]|nr:hypothetical protein BDZ89DRAFT_102759 [Hymenopellis radicata]